MYVRRSSRRKCRRRVFEESKRFLLVVMVVVKRQDQDAPEPRLLLLLPPSGFCRRMLLRSSLRISWSRKLQTRLYSSTFTPDAFKVLFFGRDEFSCVVLKELLGAKGVSPRFICSIMC